jgi:hypothetical protein
MTPIRPSGRDLSLKWESDTYAYRWFPLSGVPHTASQTEKDAMEWTIFALMLDVIHAIGEFCPNAMRFAYGPSAINTVTTRLGCGSQYEGALQRDSGSVWEVGANGRHYSMERGVLRKFREEVLSTKLAVKKQPIVAKLAQLENLRDLLDLNPECTGPATFTLGEIPKKVDQDREDAFFIDSRKKMKPLTSYQDGLLADVHHRHHEVSEWRRDPTAHPQPAPGYVEAGHLAFEASADDEEQLHFFTMKPFRGTEDPKWTRAQLGTLATIQDTYHHRWMEKIRAGSWKSRGDDTDHLLAHLVMNDSDPRLLFLFSCGNGAKIDACGKLTAQQALVELPKRLGI